MNKNVHCIQQNYNNKNKLQKNDALTLSKKMKNTNTNDCKPENAERRNVSPYNLLELQSFTQ